MPALDATRTRNTEKKLRFFFLSACMLITIFILFPPGILTAQSARGDALSLTESLAAQGLQYQHAAPAERARLLNELTDTALSRRQALLAAMEEDPTEALRAGLTDTARAGLPAQVRSLLENKVEYEGELEILHEDSEMGGRYLYFLKAHGTRYPLHFYDGHPGHLRTGARIRVSGIELDTKLALGGDTKTVQTVAIAPTLNALGEQRTLLILVNFRDNPVEPYTVDDARNVLFGTTSDFFWENSYQQTRLSGDIYGWYTIPLDSASCDTTSIKAYAEAAATAAGANLSAYRHVMYAFPSNSVCGFWGLSTVGGSPSLAWVNGAFELGVTAHELGHGFGLWHSHSLDCGSSAVIGSGCTVLDYGDILDMMGSSHSAQFNAFQKERLGWLGNGISPAVITVESAGTYAIEPYESLGSGPKALKIPGSIDSATGQKRWYYVEARQPIGFDAFLANEAGNVTNGVLIHRATEGNGNSGSLLDMTPATPSIYWWYDPAIAPGQTFSDPEAGLTITAISIGTTGAAVSVDLASSLSVALSADRATYSRGQTATITATARQGGSPVSKASVNLRLTKPDGTVVVYTGATDSAGSAVFKYRIGRKDPIGRYQASAVVTKGSQSTAATTSFTIQ